MKPVDQVVMHDEERGERGDCFRACVASILELPSDEVPHFVQLAEDTGNDLDWATMFVAWCSSRGVDFYSIPGDRKPTGWAITSGPGGRGPLHSVVTFAGELRHDPHPSRAGLVSVLDHIVIQWSKEASQ